MKKLFIVSIVIVCFSLLYAQDIIVPRTKTIAEVEFTGIKTACHAPGNLMKYYYDLPENRNESLL